MFYMRIQRKNKKDLVFYDFDTVGKLISILTNYVGLYPEVYVGHFIIRKDGKPIF